MLFNSPLNLIFAITLCLACGKESDVEPSNSYLYSGKSAVRSDIFVITPDTSFEEVLEPREYLHQLLDTMSSLALSSYFSAQDAFGVEEIDLFSSTQLNLIPFSSTGRPVRKLYYETVDEDIWLIDTVYNERGYMGKIDEHRLSIPFMTYFSIPGKASSPGPNYRVFTFNSFSSPSDSISIVTAFNGNYVPGDTVVFFKGHFNYDKE